MGKFFVGQRVKLVKTIDLKSPAKNYGIEGSVASFMFLKSGTLMGDMLRIEVDCDISVLWDGHSRPCAQNTQQLEPILPEGAQPSEFSFTELMDNLGVVVA